MMPLVGDACRAVQPQVFPDSGHDHAHAALGDAPGDAPGDASEVESTVD